MALGAKSYCNVHTFGAPDKPALVSGLGRKSSSRQAEAAACTEIALGVQNVQGTKGNAL